MGPTPLHAGLVTRALLFSCLLLLRCAQADYVVTGPKARTPIPQIAPSSCPLLFPAEDVRQARILCGSTGTSADNVSDPTPACCRALRAAIFQARVRFANSTGYLLMPASSAQLCIEEFSSTRGADTPPDVLTICGINQDSLSEDAGQACGPSLTTVYEFWNTANHTFPGIVGIPCYKAMDCLDCVTQVDRQIATLGTSSRFTTGACQELGRIAMTAAAYPILVANGIATCLHNVSIDEVLPSSTCLALPWEQFNFEPVYQSCGPPQRYSERCCDLITAMLLQLNAQLLQTTGAHIPAEQVEVCHTHLRQTLIERNIPPSVLEACNFSSIRLLTIAGCYNYSTLIDHVPESYISELSANCRPGAQPCDQCSTTYFRLAQELAKSPMLIYTLICQGVLATQYTAQLGSLHAMSAHLNCLFYFPNGGVGIPLGIGIASKSSQGRRDLPLLVGVIIGCAVPLILVVVARWWKRRQKLNIASSRTLSRMELVLSIEGAQIRTFTIKEIRTMTKNFNERELLGMGGSGKVYRGDAKGGFVAVKRFHPEKLRGGAEEFCNEVKSMASCRHSNLVALKGYCVSEEECVLVYEYLEKGSLDDHLFVAVEGLGGANVLDWPTRLKIATGAASGLAYLHEDCNPRIIHRDVKASNILLMPDFVAKISDFGVARLTNIDVTHVTTGVVGTWGYLAPEYATRHQLTEKSDVYAFGVVLLTLVAGRRPMSPEAPPEQIYLQEWAWSLAEEDDLSALIDPKLKESLPVHKASIERVTKIALHCVHTVANIRPSMRRVLAMLLHDVEVPALPPRPMTMFTVASLATSESISDPNAVSMESIDTPTTTH